MLAVGKSQIPKDTDNSFQITGATRGLCGLFISLALLSSIKRPQKYKLLKNLEKKLQKLKQKPLPQKEVISRLLNHINHMISCGSYISSNAIFKQRKLFILWYKEHVIWRQKA